MNAIHSLPAAARRQILAEALSAARRDPAAARVRRDRDFGIGYGASSGYRAARYIVAAPAPRFRLS